LLPNGHNLGVLSPCEWTVFWQCPFSVFIFKLLSNQDVDSSAKLHILFSILTPLYCRLHSLESLRGTFDTKVENKSEAEASTLSCKCLVINSCIVSYHETISFSVKQLAFELFPQARTKNDKELEPYKQRIVKAIDAVQIYIITRFFRKTAIRIFPIALPLKQENGIERVFNGYKKKYVDKVLREFITI
jgi:hypothetical protein